MCLLVLESLGEFIVVVRCLPDFSEAFLLIGLLDVFLLDFFPGELFFLSGDFPFPEESPLPFPLLDGLPFVVLVFFGVFFLEVDVGEELEVSGFC